MIATDVPGSREIVIPGKTGLLVPVDDASALADAIERLAADPALRATFGDNARRLVMERFSDATIARQIVDLYRGLLAAAAQTESTPAGDAPYRDTPTPARDGSP